MTELGVGVGNDVPHIKRFEDFVGRPVDGVMAFNGSRDWNDADPGWQLGNLGSGGRDLHWSLYMWPNQGSDAANTAVMREVAAGTNNPTYTGWARKILAADSGDDPIYVRAPSPLPLSHAAQQSDTLTLKGDWAAGAHKVVVTFLNALAAR